MKAHIKIQIDTGIVMSDRLKKALPWWAASLTLAILLPPWWAILPCAAFIIGLHYATTSPEWVARWGRKENTHDDVQQKEA